MRRLFLIATVILLLLASAAAEIDTWHIDPNHTAAQFAVRHMGISTVRGAFTKVSGTVKYDPADASKTVIEAIIDPASVDTRVEMRDKDLRSPNFFDVEKYPVITFKSKKVESAATRMRVTGDLTIHGVTREVVLQVDGPTPAIKDPRGNIHVGATATTKVNRKDFGVNGAPSMVGDEVTITLDVELVKAPAAASATKGN